MSPIVDTRGVVVEDLYRTNRRPPEPWVAPARPARDTRSYPCRSRSTDHIRRTKPRERCRSSRATAPGGRRLDASTKTISLKRRDGDEHADHSTPPAASRYSRQVHDAAPSPLAGPASRAGTACAVGAAAGERAHTSRLPAPAALSAPLITCLAASESPRREVRSIEHRPAVPRTPRHGLPTPAGRATPVNEKAPAAHGPGRATHCRAPAARPSRDATGHYTQSAHTVPPPEREAADPGTRPGH
ncbi:hypothetical protein FHS40_008992 [Streptomyces spectabilis]|uniref:Uncharacterized protein n=1 Tax=Streptomyces spectabilis TaxID=68270 RepID=A0A7W8B4Q7_STRST|nr:hypothetical protein [Streptomyces spectabilis]